MGTPSTGTGYKLCVEPGASAHTFDTSSEPYEVKDGTGIQPFEAQVYNAGMTGSRDEPSERVREGQRGADVTINLEPSPLDLDLWLPRILGAAESTDTFDLAETIPAFGVLEDRVADTMEAKDCYVNRATFSGSATSQDTTIKLALEILAKDWVENTTYPALTLGVTAADDPYVMSDGVFTFGGSAEEVIEFQLVIDNQLNRRYVNSQTPGAIFPTGRIITLTVRTPETSDEASLFDIAVGGLGSSSIAFTNGAVSTTFTFGKLQAAPEKDVVNRSSEITQPITFTARKDGSTASLSVNNDSAL